MRKQTIDIAKNFVTMTVKNLKKKQKTANFNHSRKRILRCGITVKLALRCHNYLDSNLQTAGTDVNKQLVKDVCSQKREGKRLHCGSI